MGTPHLVWVSPNGIKHLVMSNGRCMTCGRRHDMKEVRREAS